MMLTMEKEDPINFQRMKNRGRFARRELRLLKLWSNEAGRCMYCGATGNRAANSMGIVVCNDCYWPIYMNLESEMKYLKEWWKDES